MTWIGREPRGGGTIQKIRKFLDGGSGGRLRSRNLFFLNQTTNLAGLERGSERPITVLWLPQRHGRLYRGWARSIAPHQRRRLWPRQPEQALRIHSGRGSVQVVHKYELVPGQWYPILQSDHGWLDRLSRAKPPQLDVLWKEKRTCGPTKSAWYLAIDHLDVSLDRRLPAVSILGNGNVIKLGHYKTLAA